MDLLTLATRLRIRWLFIGMLCGAGLWLLAFAAYATAQGEPTGPTAGLTAVIYAVPHQIES